MSSLPETDSAQEDYRTYRNEIANQNRSNYENKYQTIRQIPLYLIGLASAFNLLGRDNWHWSIGLFSLLTILSSLLTYLLLYFVLEYAISINEQEEEIAAKYKDDEDPHKAREIEPEDQKKYGLCNKFMRYAYVFSIVMCILLSITLSITIIGGAQMSKTKSKPQADKIIKREQTKESKEIRSGIVRRPLVPKARKPDTTPKQPTRKDGGGKDKSPSPKEPPKSEAQPADKSK